MNAPASKLNQRKLAEFPPQALLKFPPASVGVALRNWKSNSELRRMTTRRCRRNVLIVGAGILGQRLAAQFHLRMPNCDVVGFLDEDGPITSNVIGRVRDLHRISLSEFVDEVVIALPHRPDLAKRAIEDARNLGLDIKLVPDLLGFIPRLRSAECNEVPLFTLDEKTIPQLGHLFKRSIDVLLSATGMFTVLPLLVVISILVKLDSPGPILYKAPRVGKKGNHFDCFKFRTMVKDADESKQQLRLINERRGAFFKLAD